jgi:hypothetical protein
MLTVLTLQARFQFIMIPFRLLNDYNFTNACQGCIPAGSAFSRAHKYKFLGKIVQVLQTPLFATFPIGTRLAWRII